MDHIPGSYPADTPVATPQATPQQEPTMLAQPPSQHHGIFAHHEHPERNKLHKSDDPRGHKQADSGVGFGTLSSDLIQSSKATEPRTLPLLDTTEGSVQSDKLADEPRRSDSPPSQRDPAYTFAPEQGSATSDEHEHTQRKVDKESTLKGPADDNSPPYWGNLPKAARGGIYNTVTGHGSPKDDHAQHHNLPQRGGVYNTVAGHGSQDEESRRHASQDAAYVAAPLPEIKEDKPLQLEETTGRSGSTHGGFLPVTTDARDTSLSGASKMADNKLGASEQASRTTSTMESGPRAFPLVSEHDRLGSQPNYEDNRDVHETEPRTRDSSLLPAAAAAGAGTSMLASEKEKPKKLQKRQGSPVEEVRGRHEEEAPRDKFIGGSLPHRPKDRSKSRSKSKGDDNSPNGKKHSILGIFHRRKDSKGEVEEAKKEETDHHSRHREEAAGAAAAGSGTYGLLHHHKDNETKDKRSTSEPMASQHDRHRSGKRMSVNENAAATVADSAGAFGILYQKPEEKAAPSQPRVSDVSQRQAEPQHSTKRMSGNESAAATAAESAGAFGILYQKPTNDKSSQPVNEQTTGSTVPRVPTKSEKRRSCSPRSSAVLADEMQAQAPGWESARESSSQVSPTDSHTQSTDAAKYAAAGATAGLGASLFAREHSRNTEPNTGAPVFEQPREPPSTPFTASRSSGSKTDRRSQSPKSMPKTLTRHSEEVTSKPGDYNKLTSGTASGVKPRASSHSMDHSQTTSNSGEEYNVLRSGTASGVKTSVMSSQRASKDSRGMASGEDEQYNHLGSGTASGVKAGSTRIPSQDQSRQTVGGGSSAAEPSDEEYNVLPSGTPSGVKIRPRTQHSTYADGSDGHRASTEHDQQKMVSSGIPSNVDANRQQPHAPQNEMEAARDTLVAAPMPMPSLGYGTALHNEDYPPLEMAQDMSPAVLPDSYKEHSHAVPNKETQSGASKKSTSSSSYSQPEYTNRSTDPALAAANGAWAASAGPSSGVPDRAKILHKCEHCGKDNDISSQFTRDNIAKMNSKSASTGNWWQSAWTSA
ncbi:hypothetical protein QBC34DRAFT_402886 [Podospora aff. communis PSN243]|uniref:Uncharacterized protein n=1 Tax=Podospora aff. communis PSN243 TaxID=3040156 RepID=A0AAV9GQP4_9PEZI|nr:hypothetical protein QBC34DRAFT_402886 [Podospora aff. communis PSN243]